MWSGGAEPNIVPLQPHLQHHTELHMMVPKDFTITEKASTRAFSWLKAPTSVFPFKTLLDIKTLY